MEKIKTIIPYIQSEPPLFCFETIASCPVITGPGKKFPSSVP